MKIVVFDTETTGFPVRDGTLDQQPYIIQFAAISGDLGEDGEFQETSRHDFLIRPRIAIPFSSSQVNGIYDKDVQDAPFFEEKSESIIQIINAADVVVGHNVSYDEEILGYELARMGRMGEYTPKQVICTMKSSIEYCKLVGRGFSYKPPKLSELHQFLFQEWFDGAHNAMVDVEATLRSFVELVKRGVIVPEQSNILRLF